MKKIKTILLIALLSATATSYAGIYNSQTDNQGTSNRYGALYGISTNDSGGETRYSSGLYRANSIVSPGGRPGTDQGIGQGTPLGDDVGVFTVGAFVLAIIKTITNKKRMRH